MRRRAQGFSSGACEARERTQKGTLIRKNRIIGQLQHDAQHRSDSGTRVKHPGRKAGACGEIHQFEFDQTERRKALRCVEDSRPTTGCFLSPVHLEVAAADTPRVGTKRAATGEVTHHLLHNMVEGSAAARLTSQGP